MGQSESRSLRNGNQVAVEALSAFERDCSLAVGRFEPSAVSKSSCSPTSRTLLVEEPSSDRSSQTARDPPASPGSSKSSPSKAKQQMSLKASRPARRVTKGRGSGMGHRACSCCLPAPCPQCHHEMLKRQSEVGLSQLDQCPPACCIGAERSSLPTKLTRTPSNERLAESAGLFSGELIASTRKQSNFYDLGGGGRERCARRHRNQLVTDERTRHVAASLGGSGGEPPPARRKGAAQLHPSRRSAAAECGQQSSISSAASVASTLTLVSSESSASTAGRRSTSAALKPSLRTIDTAAECHASSDKDALGANSNATATATTQSAGADAATAKAAPTTTTPTPDQLIRISPNNVVSRQRPTCDQISRLSKTATSTQVSGGGQHKSPEKESGIKSRANVICEPSAGEKLQQHHGQRLASSDEKESGQQAGELQGRPAPVERGRVSPSRATSLAWSELALKYGCKMSARKTSKQSIVSKTADERSEVHSYGGISLPPTPPPRPTEAGSSSRSSSSCLCHLLCALLQTLFPIIGSLKNYSLPGDLASDLAAGFTVAVLHIPQGMAYGLLSGVEPIYGLYVSFVPVLVLSLMSKARHVSYGTFAVISMLLVNTIDSVRETLNRDLGPASNVSDPTSLPLVLTDNHQPAPALKRLPVAVAQARDQIGMSVGAGAATSSLLFDSAALTDNLATASEASNSLLVEPPSGIEILACACLVCGLIHITMSLMRLGVLSLIFSDQLVSSFTTACAIHVLTSQIAGLFDLKLAPVHEELFKIFRVWWNFGHALLFESFNKTTAVLSVCSLVFLLLIKQVVEPALRRRSKRLICLPSELVLMSVAILCSWYFKFESSHNVKIIGYVPMGLPEARAPRLELVPYVFKDSITIALISYVMNLSIAQVYAKRFRYELEPNQELFALGTANIVSSFFSCFPCASSLSRSSVQSSLNVRSQLCSLFSCALVVLIICFFAHILHDLPRSTLSCIILVALKGILMQVHDLLDNWRQSKLDALVWIITFVSVIVFGVTHGLILGILSSLFMVFFRLLKPNHSILGRLPDTEIYVDVNAFAECEQSDRVKIFRFNSALCYLNRTQLKSRIEKLFPAIYKPQGFSAICAQFHQRSPFDQSHSGSINFLIIDCSGLSYCDYAGAATLVELVEELENEKVTVYLAACQLRLIDMLARMKSTDRILNENVYATISDAMGQVRYLLSSSDRSSEKKPSGFGMQAHRGASPSQSCDKSQQTTIINLP